ncbi:metallophosphoesterase family protein [Thalassiella azotivora]
MDDATRDPSPGALERVRRVLRTEVRVDGRRLGRWLLVVVVAVLGAGAGWSLAPQTTTRVGPLTVAVDVVPTLEPGVHVELPPVGRVQFATHDAPVAVTGTVTGVDLEQAQQLIASPQGLLALQLSAPQVVRDAAVRAIAWEVGCALLGAAVAGAVAYRGVRRALQTTAVATVGVLALGAGAVATFDGAALREPRFTGLLSRAPYIAGEGREVAARLESYRSGLADFVGAVTTLYAVADRLPAPRSPGDTTTVLHISDIHLSPLGFDLAEQLVEQFAVDVVVDTGDITTWGTAVESSTLSRISDLGVPYVFVRGNHDSLGTQAAVAQQPGAVVLDGDVVEVEGLTFAGIGDPVFTPDGEEGTGDDADRDLIGEATEELAEVVAEHEARDDGRGVDVALLHDPSRLDALFGQVPLVLAGHYHRRVVRVDESGTRVMVQGSTGGAGLTAAGLQRLGEGEPLPLTATLLYFADEGERAGRLVAFDQVTVGGLGLQSVTVERTTVTQDEPLTPPEDGTEDRTGDGPESGPQTGTGGEVGAGDEAAEPRGTTGTASPRPTPTTGRTGPTSGPSP